MIEKEIDPHLIPIKPPVWSETEFETRNQGIASKLKWLHEHELMIRHYVLSVWAKPDQDDIFQWVFDNPEQARTILEDYHRPNEHKLWKVLNGFSKGKSKIAIIVGARGSGKTATAFWLAEHLKKERPIYMCSPVPTLDLPDFMNYVSDPSQAPEGSFIIMDETALSFGARDHAGTKSKGIVKQMAVLRHQDKSIAFLTQHTKIADCTIQYLSDCIFYKPMSLFQADTERVGIANIIEGMIPKKSNHTLYWDRKIITLFEQPLPECWSNKISKTWNKIKTEENALEFVKQASRGGYSLRGISQLLVAKGYPRSHKWVDEKLKELGVKTNGKK